MAYALSPGVTWSEIDLTTIVPSVSTSVGAFAGHFRWGPLYEIMDVGNEDDLVKKVYKPHDDNFVDFFTCANFLSYSNALRIVRTANTEGALNATAGGVGLLIQNKHQYEMEYENFAAADELGLFAARYPGVIGNSLKVSMFCASGDEDSYKSWEYFQEFDSVPGTSKYVADRGGRNDELHLVVIDEDGKFTGRPGTILEKFGYLSKAADALNFDGTPDYYVNVISQSSNYIYIINEPVINYANVESVTVREGGRGYFSANNVSITGGVGSGATANIVCNAAGSVVRVDVKNRGDQYYLTDSLHLVAPSGQDAVITIGSVGPTGNANTVSITNAGKWYSNANNVVLSGGTGSGLTANISVNANGGIVAVDIAPAANSAGINYVANDMVYVVQVVPSDLIVNMQAAANAEGVIWGNPAEGTVFTEPQAEYTFSLDGGADGLPSDIDVIAGYDMFANPDDTDVSLIMTGAHSRDVCAYVVDNIVGGSLPATGDMTMKAVGSGRRDCVAFLSPQMEDVVNNSGSETQDVIAYRNSLNFSSSYAVMDCNWKKQLDKYNGKYRWVPLNGDIAGLCAYTDYLRDPWWSPAGFNRGHIKNVVNLAWNPKMNNRDDLYQNGINPVVNFKGEGPILYGDKTMLTKPSAFDRINVRRLFIVVEKAIVKAAKYSLFEFNDEFTRAQFVALIEPYLRDVKGRRGIYDFKVVCDESNNTPTVIDRNEFIGDIYIKPARSINFIHLNFVAVATGVAFSEVIGRF